MQPKRDEFDAALDQLPEMVSAGQLGYVLARACDKYLMGKAETDTQGQLRYQYQGDVYGVLVSILLDFAAQVNFPYEDDVRARSGEVWQSRHRLPGRNGHPV